jgi:hypothetical protein
MARKKSSFAAQNVNRTFYGVVSAPHTHTCVRGYTDVVGVVKVQDLAALLFDFLVGDGTRVQ